MAAGIGIALAGIGLLLFALVLTALSAGGFLAFLSGILGLALAVGGGLYAEADAFFASRPR